MDANLASSAFTLSAVFPCGMCENPFTTALVPASLARLACGFVAICSATFACVIDRFARPDEPLTVIPVEVDALDEWNSTGSNADGSPVRSAPTSGIHDALANSRANERRLDDDDALGGRCDEHELASPRCVAPACGARARDDGVTSSTVRAVDVTVSTSSRVNPSRSGLWRVVTGGREG